MTLIDERDKRQLGTLLWRTKVILKRSKKRALISMNGAIINFVVLIGIALSLGPKTISSSAVNQVTATSSATPENANDYFVDSGVYQTNFSLPNCTINNYNATIIGLVGTEIDQQDPIWNNTMNKIFDDINTAFIANNGALQKNMPL